MKQCPYCNELIDDRSKFCPICGKELDSIQKSEATLHKKDSVEQRRCPICDELIDSNLSICPICNEQTHFLPEKKDVKPSDGSNEDFKPKESQVKTELPIAGPPQVPDSPKRTEDVEITVEIPVPSGENLPQTDIQPSEPEEKPENKPTVSDNSIISPPVPPKKYFEKIREDEEKKKEMERTHLADQETIQRITIENNNLSAEIWRKENEIQKLKKDVDAAKAQIEELEKERDSMHQYIQYLSNNNYYNQEGQVNHANLHWIYGAIIALVVFLGTLIVLFYGSSLQLKKYKDVYYLENYSQTEAKAKDAAKVKDKEINVPNLGTYTYTGDVNEDEMPDGEGEAVFGNGDTFVGKFDDGNFSYGRYTWKEDGAYFEGKFVDNEPLESSGAYYDKKGNMRTN